MSVYDHPSKPGWQMIKISHGRKAKPEYIPYPGSRESALIYERELRGFTDTSDPGFTDYLPDFKIAYRNRCSVRGFEVCENSLKHLEEHLGAMKMRHITPSIIEHYKSTRLTKGGRTGTGVCRRTVNIELSILSAYITWLNQTHGTAFQRPKRFTKRETRPPLPQVLTIPELGALIGNLSGDVKTAVSLMAYCGMRRNEVLGMTAFNVDISGQLIRLAGKGGKWRTIPVSIPEILTDLEALCKKHPSGPLFLSPRKNKKGLYAARIDIRKPIRAAAAAAGITKHTHPHLFRHSCGAAMVNSNVDIRIIQDLFGHAELSTTQVYTQVAESSKRVATSALAAKVATEQTRINGASTGQNP